ncbi:MULTISPECIES: hypothetical protein [unclassified Moorena]|uniref:hypothetical protein n=1 Tax=unclassified Moorena TaxID=2683338 RepID=UPI0013FFA700|nr:MULTISPECIES: hypothetical protein [unclassified Moorena]NEO14849.1 hypothetical protein [Moorena sp. SIO3E8]NEQ01282.1 hypothetical protein [Moorena sp. SIO3F7]
MRECLFPAPCSLLPAPCSLFPDPLFPVPFAISWENCYIKIALLVINRLKLETNLAHLDSKSFYLK